MSSRAKRGIRFSRSSSFFCRRRALARLLFSEFHFGQSAVLRRSNLLHSRARQLPSSRHTPAPNSPAPAPTTCKSPALSQTESVSAPGMPPQSPASAPTAAAHTIPTRAADELLQTRPEKCPLKTSRSTPMSETPAPNSRKASPCQKPTFEKSTTMPLPSTAESRSQARVPPQY